MINELKAALSGKQNHNDFLRFKTLIDNGNKRSAIIHGFTIDFIEASSTSYEGSDYWVIFSAKKNGETKYFKLDGWYSSYETTRFDNYLGFVEVQQAEKVVKYWREV
jgi:hypothetical protein